MTDVDVGSGALLALCPLRVRDPRTMGIDVEAKSSRDKSVTPVFIRLFNLQLQLPQIAIGQLQDGESNPVK